MENSGFNNTEINDRSKIFYKLLPIWTISMGTNTDQKKDIWDIEFQHGHLTFKSFSCCLMKIVGTWGTLWSLPLDPGYQVHLDLAVRIGQLHTRVIKSH